MTVSLCSRSDGPSEAPVLVLTGTLGSTLSMWEPQLRALTAQFRVLRVDHRGHGGSSVPKGPYALEDLGRDMLALLDRERHERVSVCGLSLGAAVAMWLAAEAPERVERIVLMCTSSYFGAAASWTARARRVREDGITAIAEEVLSRWFTPRFAARQRERWSAMLGETPTEGYAACCEAIRGIDLRAQLARIRSPTLVLAGAEDSATPAPHTDHIAKGIAGARLQTIPGAAHLASIEQPELCNAAILHHLKGAR